jgi:hypothetical protein
MELLLLGTSVKVMELLLLMEPRAPVVSVVSVGSVMLRICGTGTIGDEGSEADCASGGSNL